MNIEQLYTIYLQHPTIRTDTRKLRPGDLFFALKGPNFNGNQFAARALELGAAYAIIDEPVPSPGPTSSAGTPASPSLPTSSAGTPGSPSPSTSSLSDALPVKGSPSPSTSSPSDALPVKDSPASSVGPASSAANNDRLILVPDVLTTLQDLALHHRKQFNIPFIAITGSNGKTTTKELIHAVLSSTYKSYTTQGNLNNHIGIPLTILSVHPNAQLAVIEMGANHQKEIEGYCRYTLPTHGLITNVGKAHLEGFGGPEGVKKGKGELYDFLRSDQVPPVVSPGQHHYLPEATSEVLPAAYGTAFVMWDYDYLREMSRGIPHIITYGTHDADITGVPRRVGHWTSYPPLEEGQDQSRFQPEAPPNQAPPATPEVPAPPATPGVPASPDPNQPPPAIAPSAYLPVQITHGASLPLIATHLVGDYNLPNILAAVAVGKHFGVPDKAIKKAIEEYIPSNSRSQLIEQDGNDIVLDAYNANPSSMRAAIENFATKTGSKVLILGAMAELGPESLNEHRAIIDFIGQYQWRDVVLVGGDFQKIDHPYHSLSNSREAGEWLRHAGLKNTYILIKGSRSMKMEEVLPPPRGDHRI